MDFVLWVSRVMHIVSAAVWIGGLIFMNAVLNPVLRHQGVMPSPTSLALQQRFFPFLWSSLWTMLVTGIFLTILSPRFLGAELSTVWGQLLAVKSVLFLALLFFSWQGASVVRRIEESLKSDDDQAEGWSRTLETLVRRSIVAGLGALLCAAGMTLV